jgi:hypothetical protein
MPVLNKLYKNILGLFLCLILFLIAGNTQTTQPGTKDTLPSNSLFNKISSISEKGLHAIDKKYGDIANTVDKQTMKLLTRMQQREVRLQKKLKGIDSVKAQQLFANSQSKYLELQAKLKAPLNSLSTGRVREYLPGLDSTNTALKFLSASNQLPADKLAQLQGVSSQVQQLQGRLQQANEVQDFIRQREKQLKDQLAQYGLGKQLLGVNKEVYYYQQQLAGYKELVNNPEKLEKALLAKVRELPAFQSFWQKNSLLAQLFPMPENYGTPAAIAGLQTRAQVQSIISQRIPSAGGPNGDPSQFLNQQLQQAQSQLNGLKDKLNQLGGGGSTDMTMPDFTPNSQHTKTFLQRISYGFNFQTTSATKLLPAISDIGLSLGYKLSDKATIGTGISYKLGLGRGIDNIAFTHQGVGLRSYADWKMPQPKGKAWEWVGSLWITGGYEYNYMQAFAKLSDLHKLNIWQKSAMAGITKKYKIGKREGNMQLLYDFLANRQVPQGQALKFRVGWSF